MLWVFGLITPALPPRRWDVNAVGDIEDVGHVVTDQDDAQVTRPPEQGPGAVFGAEPDGCLLVDRLLPSYDHAVVHARLTRTPPATCYQAAGHLNLLDSAVIRFLLGVRSLPQRIADRGVRRGRAVAPATPTFRLDDLPGYGWTLLGGRAGPGSRVRPGRAPLETGRSLRRPDDHPEAFPGFDRPGFAKIAFSLSVSAHGRTASIVTLETRVALTDPASRKKFDRYWLVVGALRRPHRPAALRLIAADVDLPAGTASGDQRRAAGKASRPLSSTKQTPAPPSWGCTSALFRCSSSPTAMT